MSLPTFHGLKNDSEAVATIREIIGAATGPVDRVQLRSLLNVSTVLMDRCVHKMADANEATLTHDGNGWTAIQRV